MSSPPTVAETAVAEPNVADPTISPSTVLRPSYANPAWLHFLPEGFIPILPQCPPFNGSPSLPPNSRTWVPAHLPRNTSWSHILWIKIIGFVQDIHCMMLSSEYSSNITINESTFNIGFLNFAVSLQHTCQLRGAFVPGRRLVEAAWVARMSTYAIKMYSASVMEHLNECLWQTQCYEVNQYWMGMSHRYIGLDIESYFNGVISKLSDLSETVISTSMLRTLDMDQTHEPHLLVKASYLSFALSGRTYELTWDLSTRDQVRVLRLFRLGLAVRMTRDNMFYMAT